MVFDRGKKFLVVFALVLATGLQWAALQTVAWTTMLASNLESGTFQEAVTKTFDGRHLCPLCKAIAAAKRSAQKNDLKSPPPKFEYPPAAKEFALVAPAQFWWLPQMDSFAESLSHPPLTPPPRGSFV